jgi:hypothetical protein
MAVVFDTNVFPANSIGKVIKLSGALISGTIVRPRLLSLSNGPAGARLGEDFEAFKAIFTSVNINEGANVQFQHTLGNAVYLNVFGDRISQMRISGVAVEGSCGNGVKSDSEHGIAKVIRYYRDSKVSSRKEPLLISLASNNPNSAYRAFLVGMQGGAMGEQQTVNRLFQFSLDFVMPPQ